jgi:hypothetical protein
VSPRHRHAPTHPLRGPDDPIPRRCRWAEGCLALMLVVAGACDPVESRPLWLASVALWGARTGAIPLEALTREKRRLLTRRARALLDEVGEGQVHITATALAIQASRPLTDAERGRRPAAPLAIRAVHDVSRGAYASVQT